MSERTPVDLVGLLEELQTIARNGLNYTQNVYDRERYERLMAVTALQYEQLVGRELGSWFSAEIGHITPKVGADAAIFNEQGEILLMERIDGSGWCLPCGWLEPNERPVDACIREAREETGLEVVATQLVGIFTRMPSAKHGPHTMVACVHLCEVVGGELTLSHEGRALRYWPIDAVPHWHATHKKFAQAAYIAWAAASSVPAISD